MDLNNDGLLDLVSGERVGYITWFKRKQDGTLVKGERITANGNDLKYGMNSELFFIDWDEDVDLDLVLGQEGQPWEAEYKPIRLYLNNGTAEVYSFTNYTELTSNGSQILHYSPDPFVGDVNGDGKKDLVVGTGQNESFIYYYENIGTNTSPVFGTPEKINSNGTAITDNGYTSTWFTDWNEDGYIDLVTGCKGEYQGIEDGWTYTKLYLSSQTNINNYNLMRNPSLIITRTSHKKFTISLNTSDVQDIEIRIFNTNGKIIKAHSIRNRDIENCNITIEIKDDISSGTYILQVKTPIFNTAKQILIMK